jgi:acetylglutamate kinase
MKIVVKLGGATLEDAALLQRAVLAVKQLAKDHQVAVVHGGGAALTRMLAQMGKQSEFIDGLRVTDAETRDFAVMVLAGHKNKKLVAALGSEGQAVWRRRTCLPRAQKDDQRPRPWICGRDLFRRSALD